jgi:large subunit ribosomal protein L23
MGILSLFRRRKPQDKRSAETPRAAAGVSTAPAAISNTLGEARGSILLSPVITEKAARLGERGWYAFRVSRGATKQDVRHAVEQQFRVHVERVNILNLPGKARRRGPIIGHVPGYRKALVALRDGERIDLTGGSA